MSKKIFSPAVLFCAFVMLLVQGCISDPVVFSEVFQLKQGEKLYTRYNLWYSDPDDISCLNIQNGTFIPIGTEIEPISTSWYWDTIKFKDIKSGKRYTIKFDEAYRLCSMRDFVAYTFTTKSCKELFKGIKPAVQSRIVRGEVVPGMSVREVLLSYGPPPGLRTPDLRNESWVYWSGESEVIRLAFRDGKVRNVLNFNKKH